MLAAAAIGLLLAIPFWLWPELDLSITEWLAFVPGVGFAHKDMLLVKAVYTGVRIATGILIASLLLLLIWRALRKDAPLPLLKKSAPCFRSLFYLLLVLAVGPGMLVHWVFKEQLERPRPRQCIAFGGTMEYAPPPFVPEYWEAKPTEGRSFPSGHSAMGYYLLAFAFLVRTRKAKALWFGTGTAAGLVVGLGRILQGGHFASDVLFSGVVVFFTAALVHKLLLTPRESTSPAPL